MSAMSGRVLIDSKASELIEKGALHVYKQHVVKSEARDGEWVEVHGPSGFLGYGFYSERSSIPVKLFSREESDPEEVILGRMERLLRRKRREAFRWVFAEGDLLPGLVVDVYRDIAVVKLNISGLERMRDTIFDFVESYCPNVVERNERRPEGLPSRKGVVRGKEYTTLIEEGDRVFRVDTLHGQKTGFYLDQHENRLLASRLRVERVLDLYSYVGAFGVQMGERVTFVDVGEWEVREALHNARMNGVVGEGVVMDVMDFLRRDKREYDAVISDPPSLGEKRKALRYYYTLHRLALRRVKDGGLYVAASCTQSVNPKEFLGVIRAGALDEGVTVRMLGGVRTQSWDHTVYPPQPETLYLKAIFLEVWK